MRAAGLYPKIAAPVFEPGGSSVSKELSLAMNSANGGLIYYTTNGLDPRVPFTDAVAAHVLRYTNGVRFTGPTAVKARVLKAHTWSALAEALLTNSPMAN